jgi:hypothetical protein
MELSDLPCFTACPNPSILRAIGRKGDEILGSEYDGLFIDHRRVTGPVPSA